MYSRRGPPKSTPTSVLCQKCLKKGHYSYECKVAPQDRPYKARPSRSQQLRNPKLAPKLHEETFNALQIKQGVADEELAKRDAERARRRRSPSYSGSDSRSPSRSPSRSLSRSLSRSVSPAPKVIATSVEEPVEARKSRSRSPAVREKDSRMKSSDFFAGPAEEDKEASQDRDREQREDREGREGRDRDRDRDRKRRHSSRSPGRDDRRHRSYRERDGERRRRHDDRHGRSSRDGHEERGRARPAETKGEASADRQERSLSPFSRRQALTKEQSGR